jgi:hypothetical protein
MARSKAGSHEYYLAHREEILEKAHEYYLTHRENAIAASRRWAKKHPDELKEYRAAYRAANRDRFNKYSTDSMLHKLEKLAGRPCPKVCELCGKPDTRTRLHFDHDHACCDSFPEKSCGRCFRGWLCGKCNKVLGMVEDSPEYLDTLATYLKGN